jgi:hypothetical protein
VAFAYDTYTTLSKNNGVLGATLTADRRTHPGKVGGQETLAEKGSVDAVGVVEFAYDIYTTPRKNNGVLRSTLTLRRIGRVIILHHPFFSLAAPSEGEHGRLDRAGYWCCFEVSFHADGDVGAPV